MPSSFVFEQVALSYQWLFQPRLFPPAPKQRILRCPIAEVSVILHNITLIAAPSCYYS